jgi:hypothetical protein
MPQCVRSRLFVFIILIAASTVLLDASRAIAQSVTLQWDANTDPQVAGYRVYYGKTSGKYTQQVDAGNVTSYMVNGIDVTQNHFFAVRAYSFDGTLSGPSNEVSLFGPAITGGSPLGGALSRVDMQSPLIFSADVRETDVAHDPVNGVYFVVGANGPVWGAFTDASGKLLATIHINNAIPGFARHPRVAYSPHIANGTGGLGGFLVTWHEGTTSGNVVRARGVAYPNQLVTATTTVHANARTQPDYGAPVAYSPTSKIFLVALEDASDAVHAIRLNLSGQPIGAAVPLSTAASAPGLRGTLTWMNSVSCSPAASRQTVPRRSRA